MLTAATKRSVHSNAPNWLNKAVSIRSRPVL
jgi:hypothetical protein